MTRFKQYKRVRLDLLKLLGDKPFGAFVKDGKISAGWTAHTTVSSGLGNIVAMRCSDVGGGILAGCANGNIYAENTGNGELLGLKYGGGGSLPFAFETRDAASRLVLVSGGLYATMVGGSADFGEFGGNLACGAMRQGRLFGGDIKDRYKLKWSGEGGFNDWSEGISGAGSLVLEPVGGYILNVFDFDGELIVFRQSSVMRFSTSGNPENIRLIDSIPVPDVAKDTMAIAGNGILFMTDSGLMRFSGGKAAKIECLITEDAEAAQSVHLSQGRFYFVAASSRSLGRQVVYVYDALYGCCQAADVPAYFLSEDVGSVLAYTPTRLYRLRYRYGAGEYTVETGETDFGTDNRKLAVWLEADCDEDVKVQISNGRRTRTIEKPCGRTRLNMRGGKFTVTFKGNCGSVRSAYLTAEVT